MMSKIRKKHRPSIVDVWDSWLEEWKTPEHIFICQAWPMNRKMEKVGLGEGPSKHTATSISFPEHAGRLENLQETSNSSSNKFSGKADASQINDDELFIRAAGLNKNRIYGFFVPGLMDVPNLGLLHHHPMSSPQRNSSIRTLLSREWKRCCRRLFSSFKPNKMLSVRAYRQLMLHLHIVLNKKMSNGGDMYFLTSLIAFIAQIT